MEEKKTKPYELFSAKPDIVEERLVMYGTLDLDGSKCYTYVDYYTWLDDRRMELIDGFIHFLTNTLRSFGKFKLPDWYIERIEY